LGADECDGDFEALEGTVDVFKCQTEGVAVQKVGWGVCAGGEEAAVEVVDEGLKGRKVGEEM